MRKLLFTLIFALAATSASAMTFDVGSNKIDLYGSVRAFAVINGTLPGDMRSSTGSSTKGGVGLCSDIKDTLCSQFVIGLQSNSRAGIKWTQGDFFVNNEWGIVSPQEGSTALRLRYLYADYKFNGGEGGRIRFGQIPGIVHTAGIYDSKLNEDNALQGFGTIAEVRRVGINYTTPQDYFGISLISMRQDSSYVKEAASLAGNSDFKNVTFTELLPRIELAYKVSDFTVASTFAIGSVIGDRTSTVGEGYSQIKRVHQGVVAGHVMVAANPKLADNVKLLVSGFASVNGGMYDMVFLGTGFSHTEAVNKSGIRAMPTRKRDKDGALVIKDGMYELADMFVAGSAIGIVVDNFEAGLGIQSASRGEGDYEETKIGMGFYANYKIKIGNFRITPEFRYLDSGDLLLTKREKKAREEAKDPVSNPIKDVSGIQVGVQFRMDI